MREQRQQRRPYILREKTATNACHIPVQWPIYLSDGTLKKKKNEKNRARIVVMSHKSPHAQFKGHTILQVTGASAI